MDIGRLPGRILASVLEIDSGFAHRESSRLVWNGWRDAGFGVATILKPSDASVIRALKA